jgi:hypothetical protein
MGTLTELLKQADGGDAGALMGGAALAGGVGAGAYFLGKSHGQEAAEEVADEAKPKKTRKPKATPEAASPATPAPEAATQPVKGKKLTARQLAAQGKRKAAQQLSEFGAGNMKGSVVTQNTLPGSKVPKVKYVPPVRNISKAPLGEMATKGLKANAIHLATGGRL